MSHHAHGKIDRTLFLAVHEAFVETTAPLIRELCAAGLTHPPEIARALNQRGFPCFGRPRWTGSLVRAVLDRAPPPKAPRCPIDR